MTGKTRLGAEGYGVKPEGSFADKAFVSSHTVGIITRSSADGYGVRRYLSFAGKAGTVAPPARVADYVNESVRYPRHERIGRPPPPEPVLPPLFLNIASGQGSQSASGKVEFLIKGAAQSSSGAAEFSAAVEFSIGAEAAIKQLQFSQSGLQLRMMASIRAAQIAAAVSGSAKSELSGVLKSGGEARIVPSYNGEEAFFESVDQAA